MRYLKYSVMIFILFSICFFCGCKRYESDSNGAGSKENPYLIYNEGQLLDLGGKVLQNEKEDNFEGVYYKLMADLDFSGVNYKPIGTTKTNSFNGVFDGNGHTIKNVTIDSDDLGYLGIFGYLGNSGEIKNLNVENINITSKYYSVNNKDISAGGIVGYADAFSKISNCKVKGNIDLYYQVKFKGSISNLIYNSDTIAGGIVGWSMGVVENSYASVNITSDIAGGVVGFSSGFSVSDSISENSEIFGSYSAGGLIGAIENNVSSFAIEVYNNKVINNIIKTRWCAGGLVGGYASRFDIANNYIDAKIIATQYNVLYVGGVVSLQYVLGQYGGEINNYTNKIVSTIANVDIKIENKVNQSDRYHLGFFGSKKIVNSYKERLYVENSLFNGSINMDLVVDLEEEGSNFYNAGVVLKDNHNVKLNEELIIENNLSDVSKTLGVDVSFIKYENDKYQIVSNKLQ